MSVLDLSTPPPNRRYSVSVGREGTAGARGVRLFKDVALFLLGVCFVVIIVWIRVTTLRSAAASADNNKWAMSPLSATTGDGGKHPIRR